MKQSEQAMLRKVEQLRYKLNQVINDKGYTDRQTIELSQALDRSLNEYYYLKQFKQNKSETRINSKVVN